MVQPKIKQIKKKKEGRRGEKSNKIKFNKNKYFLQLDIFKINSWDFPGDPVVKNPPANEGDTGSITGPGRSHMPRYN